MHVKQTFSRYLVKLHFGIFNSLHSDKQFLYRKKTRQNKKTMTGKQERTIKSQNISLMKAFLKNLPVSYTAYN